MTKPTASPAIAAAVVGCAVALSAPPLHAQEWTDPAGWDEWLLPLEDYRATQPQAAACRIYVREIGEGPTIVTLHGGWGGEHGSLLPGLLPLAEDARLVFYDQRGSLRSPCEEPPTAADHVADLERLRETLGEERLVLLGHSKGGWLAQAYAAEHPDRVAGLILVAPTPAADSLPTRTEETRWERPEVIAELERHGLVLPRRPEDTVQEWSINHRIIFAAVNLHDVTRWREVPVPWFYDAEAGRAAAESEPEGFDFTPALAALDVPVLVVAGDDDFIPLESHRAWTANVPNARLEVIERAGHIPWIDRAEAVLGAIEAYLDELRNG